MKLSVRTLDPDVRNLVLKRIYDITLSMAEGFGARAEVHHIHGSPVLINNPQMTDFAIDVARELFDETLINENSSAVMASEDFAFMLEENPTGAYFFIGEVRAAQYIIPDMTLMIKSSGRLLLSGLN
jgi:hippurate hydrolase